MSETKVRYIVTIKPGVSIGPRQYVREVVIGAYDPGAAITRAFEVIEKEADEQDVRTHLWQSDKVEVSCERSA